MITNLLASVVVTLITNTTERWPQHWELSNPPTALPGGEWTIPSVLSGRMVDDPDPQTKWVTSTIVRRTQVTFELEQEPVTKVVERQLSSIEVQYRLVRRDEWVPQAINGAPTGYWWSTNIPGGPTNGLGGRILMLTNFYYRERQPDGPSYGSPNDGLTNIPIQGWITNK